MRPFWGIQCVSVVTRNSITLLLKPSFLKIDNSLTTLSYFTSINSVPTVTTHHYQINIEAIYTSLLAVDLNFNSWVFQRTQDFPLDQHILHPMIPTYHCLWDTTELTISKMCPKPISVELALFWVQTVLHHSSHMYAEHSISLFMQNLGHCDLKF
jgi:hypothetical protein